MYGSQSNQTQQSSGSGWGSGSSGGWGGGSSNGWSRSGDRGSERGGDNKSAAKKEEEKRFGDAKSYKINSTPSVSGLPSFLHRLT
ncbi:MAG: hypothetical protein U0930_09820 [Pirellulales bacterium]